MYIVVEPHFFTPYSDASEPLRTRVGRFVQYKHYALCSILPVRGPDPEELIDEYHHAHAYRTGAAERRSQITTHRPRLNQASRVSRRMRRRR